jgi:1,4-alpha-glucan branching enzyme
MIEKGTVRNAEKTGIALTADTAEAIASGAHADPFSVLGVHAVEDGFLARVFIPGAEAASAVTLDGTPAASSTLARCQVFLKAGSTSRHGNRCASQPQGPLTYGRSMTPTVSGPCSARWTITCLQKARICASSTAWVRIRLNMKVSRACISRSGRPTPGACRWWAISTAWDGRRHVMRRRSDVGVWEIFAPGVTTGTAYKFEIIGAQGEKLPLKADPFARQAEFRPATASIVTTKIASRMGRSGTP